MVVLGTEKGADTDSRVKHNFGMARPEGYRKARRLIELAGRFGLPVLTFVDTAGAYPGIDAEARGQAEAIARSIEACLEAPVPLIATIIGEGGSGGAIALGRRQPGADAGARDLFGDLARKAAPRSCGATPAQAPTAAEALKLTAQDLKRLGLIDTIVPSRWAAPSATPRRRSPRWARRWPRRWHPLLALDAATLRTRRREKFLEMGREGLG